MKQLLIFSLLIFSLSISAQQGDPKDTEVWEPQPKAVLPGEGALAPSDATVLFDGKDLNNWTNLKGEPAKWDVKGGAMYVVKGTGDIKTKKEFGNIQLHVEWRTPEKVEGEGQGRGNSGIFIQERYELQVLDSYNSKTYANGQAGSIYKQVIPLVNACRKPGEWQVYDIIFTAPKFAIDGKVQAPAYITVLQNGVLIQNHTEIKGETTFIGSASYKSHAKAAIKLQDHGNPIGFRNIWVRELE